MGIRRMTALVAVAATSAVVTAAPAFADRLAQAPGFASDNASCVGSALTYAAHYGADGDSYPQVVHGGVGPAISSDATNDAPGTVGAFNRTLAQNHGTIMDCVQ